MVPEIIQQVTGSNFRSIRGILADYFRSGIYHEEYPAITPRPGAEVPGVVYFDIDVKAFVQLDIFEGEMYERKEVDIQLSTGERCVAMAYIIKKDYCRLLTGKEWNYNTFLANGKEKFIEKYAGFEAIARDMTTPGRS